MHHMNHSYFQCSYTSQALQMATSILVTLPGYDLAGPPPRFPVLYLLHGFSSDCFGWQRMTSIERYAAERNLAVVMPSAYNSAYTDMHFGQNYFTFLSQELPAFLQGVFPFSQKREETFVAGCSMGGYGALKWALTQPERFGAAVSFSGSLHAEDRIAGKSGQSGNQCEGIYGCPPEILPESQDLFVMLRNLKESGREIPRISLYCARDDKPYLYQASVEFKALADTLGIPVPFAEGMGGHTYSYWDGLLPKALDWCLGSDEPTRPRI